jgi:hypothetical protein
VLGRSATAKEGGGLVSFSSLYSALLHTMLPMTVICTITLENLECVKDMRFSMMQRLILQFSGS